MFAQVATLSALPFVNGVRIMPDAHVGVGSTVGTVLSTTAAIIPATIGVDIGCGMAAVKTNLAADDLPDSLFAIRNQIERDVPVGRNEHTHGRDKIFGSFADTQRKAENKILERWDHLLLKDQLGRADLNRIANQLGTLGGGNHFIEICLDTEDCVWIMLHSGSRGIGNQIGTVAINMAKEIAVRENRNLVDADLAWLDEGTAEFDAYIQAMQWAQDYAMLNRDTMMEIVLAGLRRRIPKLAVVGQVVNCHHNFTDLETHHDESVWITRKGAVSARRGQMGIIPGSMGAKSFIVQGLGNHSSYCSCSHGGGRTMSRTAARKVFSVDDLVAQTAGVECRKDEGVLDEIPGAYKNIDHVMAAQSDLVEVVHTLKQIMCVKG